MDITQENSINDSLEELNSDNIPERITIIKAHQYEHGCEAWQAFRK